MNNRSQDIKDKRKENMVAIGVTWSRTWWPSISKCTLLNSTRVYHLFKLPVTTNSVPLVFSWWRTRWPKLGTLEYIRLRAVGEVIAV